MYVPTPQKERKELHANVSLPTCKLAVINVSMLKEFIDSINEMRGCHTPTCCGILALSAIHTIGRGGSVDLEYICNGCGFGPLHFKG